MSLALVIGVQFVIVGIVLFGLTPAIRRRWPWADGFITLGRTAALVGGIALLGLDVAGGATPMSKTPNPIAFQVSSVDAGAGLYEATCARCHGVDARGGGPDARTTQVEPPSLRAHLAEHTDGDLFYWISNGLAGGMPAFGQLSETDRWNVVNYLRSVNGKVPTAAGPGKPAIAIVLPLGLPLGWAILGLATAWQGWRRRSRRERR